MNKCKCKFFWNYLHNLAVASTVPYAESSLKSQCLQPTTFHLLKTPYLQTDSWAVWL